MTGFAHSPTTNKNVNEAANDSAQVSGQERKMPRALRTNRIAGFGGFRPLARLEKNKQGIFLHNYFKVFLKSAISTGKLFILCNTVEIIFFVNIYAKQPEHGRKYRATSNFLQIYFVTLSDYANEVRVILNMAKLETLASPRGPIFAVFTFERRFIFLVSRRNIELKTSKHEFADRSHQNMQGFEGKKLRGTDFRMCARL